MTAKEYCTSHDAIAYYSGLSGLEIHGIEYGVDDYVYCASGAWVGKYSYHRVKVQQRAKLCLASKSSVAFCLLPMNR